MNTYNKYIKMKKNKLHGMYEPYYYTKSASHYSIWLLGNFLCYLRITRKTYDQIVQELYDKKYIFCTNDLDGYSAHYDPNHNTIKLAADYAYDLQEDAEKLAEKFPDINATNAFVFTYSLCLADFLNLAHQVINFFNMHKEFIIIYEDNQGKIHCEEYFPTQEELEKWESS